MDWLKDPRYISYRINAINILKSVFVNTTTLRRIERQIYNVAVNESRISSWSNPEYINNYNYIVSEFMEIIKNKKMTLNHLMEK